MQKRHGLPAASSASREGVAGSAGRDLGLAAFGGDSSAVQDKLDSVQHIQATFNAFAAILAQLLLQSTPMDPSSRRAIPRQVATEVLCMIA